MRIAWFLGDNPKEYNTSAHRCDVPAKRLAKAGHRCYVAHMAEILQGSLSPETAVEVAQADVIVLERLLMLESHSFISEQKSLGKQVWATFDDHYGLIPGSVSYETWRGGKKALDGRGSILKEFRQGLRICTGYMTPSKMLTEAYSMYNPHGQYVPNYLDDEIWSNLPARNSSLITIGWGGTSLHNSSWKESGIIPALGSICKNNRDVVVHVQPVYPDVVSLMEHWGVRYALGNWQPFSEWPKTVAKFSIGVAPLDGGRYDDHRSNLKVLEYATAGIPWVATDSSPYRGCEGGILVKNSVNGKNWYRALSEVILNLRVDNNKMGEDGREWADKFNSECVKRYEEVLGG